jgi:N-acetylmuramoyl-L-alanine amidase
LRKKKRTLLLVGLLLCFAILSPLGGRSQDPPYFRVSVEDSSSYIRVVIASSHPLSSAIEKMGSTLLVKIRAEGTYQIQRDPVRSHMVRALNWAKGSGYYMLTVETDFLDFSYDSFNMTNPHRLIIDLKGPANFRNEDVPVGSLDTVATSGNRGRKPDGLQGIKTIVIDPGHGGIVNGAQGKFGTLEKEVTLAIGLKLKSIIERNFAFRVVLTRDKDIDKSLEDRAAIANNNKAFLFISIHANSSYRKNARGSETFFLSLNATDEEARRLAYLENNELNLEDQIESEEEDDIKMILWDMAQSAFLKQSSQMAEAIQVQLNSLLKTRNRGIRQAPFKVLTGVACPAALVEVAFISNPEEEKKLTSDDFQNNVAQAIYNGIINFIEQYPDLKD